MSKVDAEISIVNIAICDNLSRVDDLGRGLLSQNILAQLRNLAETIAVKVYTEDTKQDLEYDYDNISLALKYISSQGEYKFLRKFHKLLQPSASHYTSDKENSERLMLKYCKYLVEIKNFLKDTYNQDILTNLDNFPLKNSPALDEYYREIVSKIEISNRVPVNSEYDDRYYIRKIKPFFVDGAVYYEVTFTIADDNASKFDRTIAFTKCDILPNYAVRLKVKSSSLEALGRQMPILIIDGWEVAIRPCEFQKFASIFGVNKGIFDRNSETKNLMKFLTANSMDLVELVDLDCDRFAQAKEAILKDAQTTAFFDVLDSTRGITSSNRAGCNILRYLLHGMNNKIIKKQYSYGNVCDRLSSLHLEYGCIPFDNMPFNSSLINHNPKLADVFDCIDSSERDHEILARKIRNNIENCGQLFTPKTDLNSFADAEELIDTYNSKLYYKHRPASELFVYGDNLSINSYVDDTNYIIGQLRGLATDGIEGYKNSVEAWLNGHPDKIDDDAKKDALKNMFEKSKIAVIYGAAGTGKSTMIDHISQFFHDKNTIFLSNTNPAVENLRRKVTLAKQNAMTIARFLHSSKVNKDCDILVIDECSTVSNRDMRSILERATFKLLVLVGDVYQIESITFGNWFNIARSFLPETAVLELIKPFRSKDDGLLKLWSKVRTMDDDIVEHMTRNKYSATLDSTIFQKTNNDEIILCLNYDGLYGINNINRFLQEDNPNSPVSWGVHTYKIGDPILFNESERFTPLVHNNLKGKIVDIQPSSNKIQFDIELDKAVNQLDVDDYPDLLFVDNVESGNSVIRFSVDKLKSTDDDDELSSKAFVPFQVAYSVSIHKAQGLEYDSVKIVIADEVDELITHNILYTAITRAISKLKIYWTPETSNKILGDLTVKSHNKDIELLRFKYNL